MANGVHRYSINAYLTLRSEWRSVSDIAGNYSDITVDLYIDRGSYGQNNNSTADETRIFIDGQEYRFTSNIGGGNNSSKLLGSSTKRVNHNEDGSKSIDIRIRKYIGVWWSDNLIGTRDYTFNVSLDTIPRLSDFNISSSLDMGLSTMIRINPKITPNIFDHRIRFLWHSRDDMVIDYIHKNTLSYNWIPSLDYANDIPNSVSSWGTVVLETWLNGVRLGEVTKQVTLNVPENIVPTFDNIELVDSNIKANDLLPGNNFIKIISNIKATITGATSLYGSKISGYIIEVVGKDNVITQNGGLLGVMNYSGTYDIRATVMDSRGRKFSKTIFINVLDYFSPVANFKARRIGADAQTLEIERSVKIAPLTIDGVQKNNVTVSFKRKLSTEKDYVNAIGGNTVTDKYIITNFRENIGTDYLANKSYQIMMIVSDAFFSFESVTTVATEQLIMHYTKNGVGVGKPHERGALDVSDEIYAFDKLIQMHALTEKDGTSIYKYNSDFNQNIDAGYFFKRDTDTNNPVKKYGWLTVKKSLNEVFQMFTATQTGETYVRFHVISSNTWTAWMDTSRASFLSHRNGGYAHAYCQKGTDLGEFLKSSRTPIGLSVIRDQNVSANIIVIKESNNWIYGLAFTQQRLEVVRVLGGAYRGYSGWALP